jgi:hypothetical protein
MPGALMIGTVTWLVFAIVVGALILKHVSDNSQ